MPATEDFHPAARAEFNEAVDYYLAEAANGPEVAGRFSLAVRAAVDAICAAPDRWRVVERSGVRRYVLPRFPYVILYRWQAAENLVAIYAVMHASRRPGYWRERLSG